MIMLRFLSLAFLSFMTVCASAQDNISQRFGSYEVFYSTFNSSFISTDVAKAYGFIRGKNKAFINLAVIKHNLDGTTKNVNATLKGTWSDLIYTQPLQFKRIQEQASIYYLSPFEIQHKNDIYFTIAIYPEGSSRDFELKFKKRLFVDGED